MKTFLGTQIKKQIKDIKKSGDSFIWKTNVESGKEKVIEINKTVCAKESNKALCQAVGKQCMAAGILFEEFCRHFTKMEHLQNAEHNMLKPKVTSEHSNWHLNCQEILIKTHKILIRANRFMNWVSKKLFDGLQDQNNRLNYRWLENNARLSCIQRKNVSTDIDDLTRSKDRPAKIKSLLEKYNGHLTKFTDQV